MCYLVGNNFKLSLVVLNKDRTFHRFLYTVFRYLERKYLLRRQFMGTENFGMQFEY